MYRFGHASTVLFLVSCCVGFTGCESKKLAPEGSPAKTSSAVETNSPTTQPAAVPTKESKPAVGNDPASETKTVPSVSKTASSAPSGGPDESSKSDVAQNGLASSQPAPAAWQKPEANLSSEQLAAWAWPEFEPLELLAAKESDQLGLVTCAARTLDGNAFILAGSKLTLWSVKGSKPEEILHQTEGNENYLRSIAVSADGKWLAAGDSEGTVKIWWLDDHTERVSKKLGEQDIVDLAFSPDSKSIATISFDNEVSIWSTENLEPKSKIKVSTNSVARMGFVDNERVIVFGETTSVWKIDDGKQDKELSGDRYNRVVGYTNDRQSIILGGETELRRWKITDDQPVSFVRGAFADNEMVVFSPDEKNLATANGNTIRIWDVAGQHCVQVIDVVGSTVVGLQWLPGSNLLVAVPDSGAVRVWGTRKSGAAVGLSPVHSPLTTSIADKTPAYAKQVADAIDFRSFPILPGSTSVMATSSTLAYEAPVKFDEAKLFYRHHLGQRGWQESSAPSANPMGIEFRKDGFMISASFYESSPTATSVNLNHAGNFDLRWLPRFDAAPIEESYASEHNVSYRTKSDILTIETTLLRELHEAGFTGYSRLHASRSEAEDARNLDFVNHSVDLRVTIQKFPVTSDSYTISYSRFLTDHALPIPDDSGYVEFDGSTQPYLVANTSRSLAEMTQFYDSEMAKQGWLPALGRSTKDEACWLPYYQGQKDVLIGLVKLENGKTRIQVGKELENSSWQLQKPADKDAAQSATGESSSAPGLEAADFPILPGAQDLKIDPQMKTLEFRVEGTPLAELAKQYTESMAKLGWVAETGGVRSDEYTYFNFEKDDLEIAFRATQRQGNAQVSIEGDGLLWNKALPGGKKVVSFQSWLRENKLPAGLDLLDRYSTEMKAISGNK